MLSSQKCNVTNHGFAHMSPTKNFDFPNHTNNSINLFLLNYLETLSSSLSLLSLMYAICIGFGIAANVMAIYLALCHKDMHTTTHYFFCNLAVTDVCFLLFYGIPNLLMRNGILFKHLWICRFVHFARKVRSIHYIYIHFLLTSTIMIMVIEIIE